MKHFLVAAAVPEGAIVRFDDEPDDFFVDSIENGTPRPGRITWTNHEGTRLEIGGNTKVEVVKFEREED